MTGAVENHNERRKKICQNDKITVFIGYFLNLLLGVPNFFWNYPNSTRYVEVCECVVASISMKRNLHMRKYTWKVQRKSDSAKESESESERHD